MRLEVAYHSNLKGTGRQRHQHLFLLDCVLPVCRNCLSKAVVVAPPLPPYPSPSKSTAASEELWKNLASP